MPRLARIVLWYRCISFPGGTENEEIGGNTTLAAFCAPIAAMALFAMTATGHAGMTETPDAVRVPLKALDSGKALFLSMESNGVKVHYFVLRGGDGTYRAALDACDVCFRANKGYRQEGDRMVCVNCGQAFPSDRIGSIHHRDRIRMIAPFLVAAADASGKNFVWMGLPRLDMADARPWWKIDGSPVGERGEVVLGAEAAAALGKGPGGTIAAGKRSFRVAGVLRPTGGKEDGMVIADLPDVQELSGARGAVTYFEVAALCKDCPVEDIVAQIGQALPGARVSAIRQVVESRKAAVDQLRRMGYGVSVIVMLIGGLMVLVTVMGGVQERTPEIGVLRAVGFRGSSIQSLLLWETGLVSFLASLLGAGAGVAAAYAASPMFGIGEPGIAAAPALLGVAAGLLLGLAGAVPPARRAAALSPAEAIRSL